MTERDPNHFWSCGLRIQQAMLPKSGSKSISPARFMHYPVEPDCFPPRECFKETLQYRGSSSSGHPDLL